MRYWDASALVTLLVQQSQSEVMLELYREDANVFTWWATNVECYSALMRLKREKALDEAGMKSALDRLEMLQNSWTEVLPQSSVRRTALRMLRVHPLRAADSLQLAAAMIVCEHEPERLCFVSLDQRQSTAAGVEGFQVI